jgi:fructose-bisphosphate aldolase, class I
LLFKVSTGTVGGISTSPTATTSPAAIDPVPAPREGAPLAGFAPARAQLARLEATALLAATRAAAMACQLETWRGEQSNLAAAQAALQHRARLTGAARRGEYSEEMEQERDQVAAAS